MMVDGLQRAAELADLEAAAANQPGQEHTRERFHAFAVHLRRLADTEDTPLPVTDVRDLQTRLQRLLRWFIT